MEANQQKQGSKRKMDCCDQNPKKQRKDAQTDAVNCDYCECVFYSQEIDWIYQSAMEQRDEHMRVHECPECHDIAVGDDERIHRVRHRQEAQLTQLQEQRQREMDDDFVHGYVKANRLSEYRPQLDYEPDVDYIMLNYRFEKDGWLSIMTKFKRPFLDWFYRSFEEATKMTKQRLIQQLNAQHISYLLGNRALSVHDAIDFLNILINTNGFDDVVSAIVSHLLENGCKIKAEWVARAISDDGLIERIKEKQSFTFGDIHKARKWDALSPFDVNGLKTFYTQLQKHFFNPEFENPFDDLNVTDRVRSHEQDSYTNQFLYDKENDQLIQVKDGGETMSCGSFADVMSKSLTDLIKEYIKHIELYDKLDESIDHFFAERDGVMDDDSDEYDEYAYGYQANAYPNQLRAFYSHAIEHNRGIRREQAHNVAKAYFALSIK